MTPILFYYRARIVWIIGACIEIEYVDCGDEVITRSAQNLHRATQVASEIRQLLWAR